MTFWVVLRPVTVLSMAWISAELHCAAGMIIECLTADKVQAVRLEPLELEIVIRKPV